MQHLFNGLLLLLTLASPWTGAAFTVDEDGLQMGPWFPLLQSVVLLCYLFVTIVILRHRSVLRRREFVFLLLYILIPLAGGLSRIVLPNIVLVNAGFTVATLLILMNVQFEHEVMLKEQEKQLAEGRIDIMLSQIQPHFLFNALISISVLCEKNPMKAQTALNDFADYLRGNLDSLRRTAPVPFSKELKHIKIYLSLEQMRFESELNVVYDIEADSFLLPALTVQPLVENAVKYGVGKKPGGGTVTISTREEATCFSITVADDGVGYDPQETQYDGRTHIGIDNVRARLAAMVGGTLTIQSEKGRGTSATIQLPKEKLT